jgi:hypothetical protein
MFRPFSPTSLLLPLAFSGVLTVASLPQAHAAPVDKTSVASTASESAEWYAPKEEDFRPHYEQDAANRSAQAWKDYYGWVKCFYEGNLLDSGWTRRCQDLLSGVKKESTRNSLRAKLNTLGRRIAAEWAKGSKNRKVDTNKLIAWGQRLKEAKEKDAGEGAKIQKELELIAKELDGVTQ